MKRLLWIPLLFLCSTLWAAEPVQLARTNPYVAGAVASAAACGASIFEDNFASNDYSAWTAEVDTGSLLSAASGASVFTLTAITAAYSTKTLASAVAESWIQFDITYSAIDMGAGGQYLYIVLLRDDGDGGAYWIEQVMNAGGDALANLTLKFVNDAAATTTVNAYALNPSAGTKYTIKIYSKRATDVDTSDGILKMYVDGTLRIDGTGLDYYTNANLQRVRLGNSATTWADTSGNTVTWDNFEWRADDCF